MLAFIAVYTRSGRGIYPSSDPWGKAFSGDYEPARFKKAGQLLVTPGSGAARGIFDGIQADLEFVKKILFLQRNSTGFSKPYSTWIETTLCTPRQLYRNKGDYSRKQCCFLCGALQWIYEHGDPTGLPNDPNLLYTNFGPQALHRTTLPGWIISIHCSNV